MFIALLRVGVRGRGQARLSDGFVSVPGRCSQCGVCSHGSAHSDAGLRLISFGKAVDGPPAREPPGQGTLPGLVAKPMGGPLRPLGYSLE